jgi:hypothetical protein
MTAKKLPWEELSAAANNDRRREQRLRLAFPVEVVGFDSHGAIFSERTVTTDISATGCRLHLKRLPDRNSVLAIRLNSRRDEEAFFDRPLLFEVMWLRREGDGWAVGVAKLAAETPERIWKVSFPSEQASPAA